jgi:signal transduction histidine kinase
LQLRDILDDGRDYAGFDQSRRSAPNRLILSLMVGVLLFWAFGWRAALAWGVANVALEILLTVARRRFAIYSGDRRGSRWMRLAPPVAFSAVWSALAVGCWVSGSAPMQFAGLMVLFGIMIEGLKYAAMSRSAFLCIMPFPAVGLVVAPISFGGFSGRELVFVIGALATIAVCVVHVGRTLRNNAVALETAQAEALEASRAKSAFVAMMSHELRTPMNGVLGMAHALATTPLTKQQATYLDMIVQSGDGLLAILNDVLDLSKIEAGKLELEVAPFDVEQLSRQLYLLWSETARMKGIELSLELDPATPRWLAGDAVRVRQVLLNLISNALKFTERGSVSVQIRPALEGGIEVVVTDTGIGMTPEQQGKLFQAFTQAESSTTRRFGGTGLGLSICRQLVEMMGGTIWVQSRVGEGSAFHATLPLAAATPPRESNAAPLAVSLEGRHVLVVDDNHVNQAVARAILEAAGARISTADDGIDALDKLRLGGFDLVLMDVHMPRMDGVEALGRIRAGDAGRPDLPVIALTADAMSGEGERLTSLGFDDAHPKPIQPAELMRTVAEWCSRPTLLRGSAAA